MRPRSWVFCNSIWKCGISRAACSFQKSKQNYSRTAFRPSINSQIMIKLKRFKNLMYNKVAFELDNTKPTDSLHVHVSVLGKGINIPLPIYIQNTNRSSYKIHVHAFSASKYTKWTYWFCNILVTPPNQFYTDSKPTNSWPFGVM